MVSAKLILEMTFDIALLRSRYRGSKIDIRSLRPAINGVWSMLCWRSLVVFVIHNRAAWASVGLVCESASIMPAHWLFDGIMGLVYRDLRPRFPTDLYLLPHQSNMPPMRPPVSNAFFCFASRLS